MNGRAHQKIAMLSYAIVATIPTINSMIIFNNKYIHIPMGISIIGLGTAALSGLLVDADSQNSKINHMNPLTGTSNKVINSIENVLKLLLRLLLGIGSCALILWNSKTIISSLSSIKYLVSMHIYRYTYAEIFTYFISFVFLILGITSERTYKKIPIIGKHL